MFALIFECGMATVSWYAEFDKAPSSIMAHHHPDVPNLGDVTNKTVPKMSLLSKAKDGGLINTRTFIPHRAHDAIGVLGAVSVATACMLKGSVAAKIAGLEEIADSLDIEVEHPTGFFTVQMEVDQTGGELKVTKSALLRTARLASVVPVAPPTRVKQMPALALVVPLIASDAWHRAGWKSRTKPRWAKLFDKKG